MYQAFAQKVAQIEDLGAAIRLLAWDQEVMMPKGGIARRAGQLGTLSELRQHQLVTELWPAVQDLKTAIETQPNAFTEVQRLNVLAAFEHLQKQVKLPTPFVAELARVTSEAQHSWEEAKRTRNFNHFQGHLSQIITLKQQEADYYGYNHSPYNALLESYEPGANVAFLDAFFDKLRPILTDWLAQIARQPQVDDRFLYQAVPQQDQWQFGLMVLNDMGFDPTFGRQDISTHPFTMGVSPEDVRLTTRVDIEDIGMMLYATIHEGGHGLYEQGLNRQSYGLPHAEACSLSIHESQSRIWENNIGRSLAFWERYFEPFAALFPDKLKGKTPLDVFRGYNKITPSLIRISADELTYHLHILLRYEIERGLIENTYKVADLPAIWSEKVQQYFGLTVPDDTEGVLQDVHWSLGSIGYFPTYTLGSFYAAQFYDYAAAAIPNLEHQIRNGQFGKFKAWLHDNIYQYGRLYNSDALCHKICGKSLDPNHFLKYMAQKINTVYGLALTVT